MRKKDCTESAMPIRSVNGQTRHPRPTSYASKERKEVGMGVGRKGLRRRDKTSKGKERTAQRTHLEVQKIDRERKRERERKARTLMRGAEDTLDASHCT